MPVRDGDRSCIDYCWNMGIDFLKSERVSRTENFTGSQFVRYSQFPLKDHGTQQEALCSFHTKQIIALSRKSGITVLGYPLEI